ncbi:histone acetyltransferase type B catalytic subunit isoform X2 [Andrographis paniculata]|uniref:histone acetyltransferase type B catalytic subunit isoform X2 n=1 Tax=Andrographis paniculata TaxID=175694 RepID=UPI0021E6DA8A|nr:histone acetyltransferase type B catalytic subunit isoform X2 [Andrographis paniculata]
MLWRYLYVLDLAFSKEEVDSPNIYQIQPVDVNHFFEDERIYGYQDLQITVWLSGISFHAFAEISFESSSDGGKGITDLKASLQNMFAENLVEKKEDFLQTFSSEGHFVKSIVSSVDVLQIDASDCSTEESKAHLRENVEVFQVRGAGVGPLYARLVPLVLLLVDGSNPIDITDPSWELYIVVQKATQDSDMLLVGFASVYRFYKYPDSTRMRLGQILIIPPYQRKGYGTSLLKALNNVAISDNLYDLTIEEPVDSLQHVRTCIDVQRLLKFAPINEPLDQAVALLKTENFSKKSQPTLLAPPPSLIEEVRKSFKINRIQFRQCWEILIYIRLDPIEKYLENYKTTVSNRIKADVIGKESKGNGKRVIDIRTDFEEDDSFSMFKTQDKEPDSTGEYGNQNNQEEELKQLVDQRMETIESVARCVSSQ